MNIDWIEDRIDVFIENGIKERQLRRKINYVKKILRNRNSNSSDFLLGYNINDKDKSSKRQSKTEIQEELDVISGNISNLYRLHQDMHEVVYNIKQKLEAYKGIDVLSFNDAFFKMRTEFGPHYLFDWRGKLYTTDIFEERSQNGKQ